MGWVQVLAETLMRGAVGRERAFDSEWPRVCDELIVDFAIQHMETNKADNSAGSDVSKAASLYELDGKALFPDAADDKDDVSPVPSPSLCCPSQRYLDVLSHTTCCVADLLPC